MSEGRLRARVTAARREEAWAPRYVADELDATHEALRVARTDATVWEARAAAEPDPDEATALRAAAADARDRAAQLAEQVAELTVADDARSLWLIETSVTRELAERARYALGLRGIDVDHPDDRVTAQEWLDADTAAKLAADAARPITELDLAPDDLADRDADDHADEQPADEHAVSEQAPGSEIAWPPVDSASHEAQPDHRMPDAQALDEHADNDRAENGRTVNGDEPVDARPDDIDTHKLPDVAQPITDVPDDEALAVDVADAVDVVDVDVPAEVQVPEVAVLDIRDAVAPDAGERVDPQQRRRVPLRDETAETVDRARLAVAEIEARRTAEAAALNNAPEPVDDRMAVDRLDEDERRDDLIRWAEDRDEGDGRGGDTSARRVDGDGEALGQ